MKTKNKHNDCYMIDFVSITANQNFFRGRNLDTLGQIGTENYNNPAMELRGLGSSIEDKSMIFSRARRKHISIVLISELIKRAQKKGDEEFEKHLWIARGCLNQVVVHNYRAYGRYCRSRTCLVCSAIRKAQMINKYLPTIENWEDPYFVTLTVKSCYAKDLDERMKEMISKLQKILARLKKRHQRGVGPKIEGIRSLECNFNANVRTYNPHFHLIVSNREAKKALIVEWLKEWGKEYAGVYGQHSRRIKELENDLIETIKYGSKIFTEPNPNAKNKNKATKYVYISALYNIHSSMRGLRLFDRFGFQKVNKDVETRTTKKVTDFTIYSFYSEYLDWINEKTGEVLSGYTPKPSLTNLLEKRIVKDIE